MTEHAAGTFDVDLQPRPLARVEPDSTLGRMTIDKTFHGDLEGTGRGEMLMAGSAVKGSAGYVAIERVVGTLKGRAGGFVLQHSGTMDRGAPRLEVTVVPDSDTGALAGITGTMAIEIVGGEHRYRFDYRLAAPE